MKRILAFTVTLWIAAVLTAPASADIIVLNNGQAYIGKVSSAASGRLKLTTDYGDQFFSRNHVAGFYMTPQGMEAEGYYQAGVLISSKGQRDVARQLFERCVKYDPSYRNKCNAALKGEPSAVSPATAVAAGTPGAPGPAVAPARPGPTLVYLECPHCSGSGSVMDASTVSGRQRPVPCPICGGKGAKVLRVSPGYQGTGTVINQLPPGYRASDVVTIPPGYEICSDCGGFGATAGGRSSSSRSTSRSSGRSSRRSSGRSSRRSSSSSSSSGFTMKKTVCPRCAGRGIVKKAWAPPQATTGAEGSAVMMVTGSPAPGTPPHGALPMAKNQARTVASRNAPSRPVGPAAIRPISPTFIEDTPPAEDTEEEIVEESEGSPSEPVTQEGSDESPSDEETDVSSTYTQPGFSGWVGRNKWYVVLGGIALLVFAIVFNKMSAKK